MDPQQDLGTIINESDLVIPNDTDLITPTTIQATGPTADGKRKRMIVISSYTQTRFKADCMKSGKKNRPQSSAPHKKRNISTSQSRFQSHLNKFRVNASAQTPTF